MASHVSTSNSNGSNGNGSAFGLPNVLGKLGNVSAAAVLIWIVIYELPATRKSFLAELKEIRQHDEVRTDKLRESLDRTTDALKYQTRTAHQHIAAVEKLTAEFKDAKDASNAKKLSP